MTGKFHRVSIGIVVILIGIAAISWKFGPYDSRRSECGICAKSLYTKSRLGIAYHASISGNQVHAWLKSFQIPEHDHLWIGSSVTRRRTWFGGLIFGCGPGPIGKFYSHRALIGEDAAIAFVSAFQEKLVTNDQEEAMRYYSEHQLEEMSFMIHGVRSNSTRNFD